MKDGIKSTISAAAAALALLFFLSLAIAENLGLPVSISPNQTQASQTHYNQNTPFNVTLFANATNGDLLWCNASITLNGAGINFTSLPGAANTTYIGNITNQSTTNTSWELVAPGRGPKYINFSLSCNGSSPQIANTTVYVDLLNVTLVNVTTPYSIRWNDSYIEVYRNSTYNISVTVANIVPTQTLTNVTVYLNDVNSSAFSLSGSSQQIRFNASAANAPVGTAFPYNITSNDSQMDRLEQPLLIRIISPLNVSLSFNDSYIVANQSFTATATASNYGPLNLTTINLTLFQYDGAFLTATNSSCAIFSLTPANTSNNCVWTFNATNPNSKANLTITATSQDGDNNEFNFSTRVYGRGSFTVNTTVAFGLHNHTDGSIALPLTIIAGAEEDMINFNCAPAGDLSSAIACQSLPNLSKSTTTSRNLSLAIPPYTTKGMHYGNVSLYAENANPQNVNYSINITGIKNCSGQASASLATRPGGSSTPIVSINVTNTGNALLNATCSACSVFTGPSIGPGGSAAYNISVSMVGSTSTSVRVDCANNDPDLIAGTTNFTFTIYYPAADTGGTTQNTNNNNNQVQTQTQQNATTYTYTVGLLPAAATINKGDSKEFTVEVKNTGTGALSNITVSGDSTLQFSVTPTKITSIPKGQSGYSKITVTTTNSTAAGNYKVAAKACRTTTSCVTSAESTLTIAGDEPAATEQNETNRTGNATEAAEQKKSAALNVTATDNAIKLILANTTDNTSLTTYLEVVNASGIVVYNITSYVQPTNGSANYDLSLPEKLKAGNYTLRIALKDLAGNTIAEKTISYTSKAAATIPPPKTTSALSAKLTPTMLNGLLVVIMALFIIAGIKTSKIGIGGIKDRLNLKQKMLDKAQTAYQQGEYGIAKEYKASAERVSKAELDIMQKIADSEKRILQMYKEGRHLQARKEQETLARMKKELELLREQHKN